MNTVKTVRELRAAVARARGEGKRIGFVPTMGNLHSGHAALVTKAAQRADFVVASIFVNPLQFGANEDLDKYPRTLAADQERLLQAGCNLLFAPSVEEMYPDGMSVQTRVSVPHLPKACAAPAGPVISKAWPPWSASCSTWSSPTLPCSVKRTSSSWRLSAPWCAT